MVFNEKKELSKSHKVRTECCCAYCGAPSEHETFTCTVTMQHGNEEETCMVHQAGYQPQGNCKSVSDALIAANNVREKSVCSPMWWEVTAGRTGPHTRRAGRLLERMGASMIGQHRGGRGGSSCYKRLLERCEAALMLMDCDSGAERSFFRTFELDCCGTKQFCPPFDGIGLYDLVSRPIEIIPADEPGRDG